MNATELAAQVLLNERLRLVKELIAVSIGIEPDNVDILITYVQLDTMEGGHLGTVCRNVALSMANQTVEVLTAMPDCEHEHEETKH